MCTLRLAVVVALAGITPLSADSLNLKYDCAHVARVASEYLGNHGVNTSGGHIPDGFDIWGYRGRWTDAQGSRLTDLRIYRTYLDRKSPEKLPFGIWHLRLDHYRPVGKMSLSPNADGCQANLRLRFDTGGAIVVAIIVLDSQWESGSNGRMEREYLEGIGAALAAETPKQP